MAPKSAFKKVKIEYPPVPRKKWIPPDERPKEPRVPAYVKPKGISQPLKISSLVRIWHKFVLYQNSRYVLAGSFSQTHKRFRLKTNGMQGSCNCIVACIMANIFKMEQWDFNVMNQILFVGDKLYEKSILKIGDRSLGSLTVTQVYPTFYLHRYMITFQVVNPKEPTSLVVSVEHDQVGTLTSTLTEFLEKHHCGAMKIEKNHIAIWKYDSAFFLFDPTEHQKDGEKWHGLVSTGFSICVRFIKIQTMAEFIVNENIKGNTLRLKIWPLELIRCQMMSLKAPENLDDIKRQAEDLEKLKEASKTYQAKEARKQALQKAKNKKEDAPVEIRSEKSIENMRRAEEISPDLEVQTTKSLTALKRLEERCKIPMEPHLQKSITFFTVLEDSKMGIIRAATHQLDKKFSRFRDGEQSLSQAVAALVMRRCAPTHHWIKKYVNDILKLGEVIHHKSTKTKTEGPFGLSNIVDKIVHPPGQYTLDYEELALLGKLESDVEGVLDLLPALMTFLRTYDCCVVNGPVTLAVWYEDNRYYMYDPNERDDKGRAIDKAKSNAELGTACVTWFSTLKDLVRLYVENLPKELRRNDFHLSKVIVEDYVGKPENWNNFQGIVKGKWILRGTLNQSSHVFSAESRNSQCTANAVMSIAFLQIKEADKWSKKTIDQVLMSGDEFYRATVERLKETNNFVSKMLMVDELNRNFSFSNKEVVFDIIDCCVNGILGYPDRGDVLNVKTGLMKFFQEFDFGVLTCRNISLGVWRINGDYFVFDSHSLDEKGIIAGYGTACVMRVLTVDELSKTIETNLKPDKLSYFNISSVNVNLLEAEEEGGTVRLPLNNFKQMGDNQDIAILASKSSCKNKKYEFNAGKQTVPMCIAALGMNRLRPSSKWNEDTLEIILDIGHKYFEQCMAEYEANPEVIEEDKGIVSKYLMNNFKIGLNKMELNLQLLAEGFVEDGLAQTITDYYTANDKITDQNYLEILVETENITVSVWKDQNLFYIFDPYPRDANGQVIGKDAWSAKVEAPEVEAGEGGAEEPAKAPKAGEPATEEGGGDLGEEEEKEEEKPKRPRSSGEGVFEEDEEEPEDPDAEGKACILFFYNLEDVVNHILENTRPNQRSMMPFTINKVEIKNIPLVKEIFNKDFGERKDSYSGNWYNFVELDHGHWILRGQIDLKNEMFPEENRGKQVYPSIISALAFAKLYAMSKMKPQHLTSILSYGDRLLTYTKRLRKEALAQDKTLNLLEDEIKAIIKNDKYEIESYPKSFVIGDSKVNWTVTKNILKGDTTAKTSPDILDVHRALNKLFQISFYGIIESKGYSVGVWKGSTVYYMFDPHNTGITGARSPIGYPCITRYLKTELLADIFLQNIPIEGLNVFTVHQVTMNEERYQRTKDIMEKAGAAQPIKISGFTEVIPGKTILRGSYSQDDPKFGRGENVLSAPVAYIALTMSLIHKPETWAKPIVDEVICVADELFNHTMMVAEPDFNPWEDTMDPHNVAKDYRVGVLQANLQIRNSDQAGILDIRDTVVLNLRQGLERFFMENTHGIIYSPPNICYAIWEQENDGHSILYMFDPNKRGPTGLPSPHGVACVLTFASPKMAADHILACIKDPQDKHHQYTILPVEITVGPFKTSKAKKKTGTTEGCCDDKQSLMKKLAHQTTIEEKKTAKKRAMIQKKKKDDKKRYWQGRTGYFDIPKCQAILRGTRCLTSNCYQEKTRGLQDIPVCIVAFVANHIVPISEWTWKEIDAVLDTGDQLYIDSYIAYSPRNKKLGLENIIRNIFIMNNRAHVTIYKPISILGFHANQLTRNFDKWFLDENFCMLNYMDQWVGVFFKKGYYFLFDPNQRGALGCRSAVEGAACVLRFEKLDDLSQRLVNNLLPADQNAEEEREEEYELVLVRLEGGICQCI
ncbi:uncharacterized protein LOC123676579 [Harmonia axyridis]|uniref:uncharacterized protein LOC123676579 n=1 Tax=Harmonia axyridis TaxID=115357 RepID=UPI001E278BF5|nr:uncharacterized protein LOC123676579 [Harmonia axyridis]XP_045468527.1 uncharacterized protein LOC123676579 [Harmonia axyridis]